jgi:ankyrin repeat protein
MGFMQYFVHVILSIAHFLDKWFYYILSFLVIYNVSIYFFINRWDTILYDAAAIGNVDHVEKALKNSPNVNAQKDGESPLMVACRNGHSAVVAILLRLGTCKLELVDDKGCTALLLACSSGWVDIVELLVEKCASLKAIDSDGNNGLIRAASEF